MLRIILFINILLGFSGCVSNHLAPIEELNPQFTMNRHPYAHIVKQGDTLYAIAFLYDQHIQTLIKINHLVFPYKLFTGQKIILESTNSIYSRQKTKFIHDWPVKSKFYWKWPTQGHLSFYAKNPIAQKGITIQGQYKQPIFAAANGVVAYAGNGLLGYGNLILIKHVNDYLSAYAYNDSLFVKEGQYIKAGQKIATMGKANDGLVALHFEIRYRGQVLNPLKLLPPK